MPKLSLATTKKGGSMGGFFLNHGFCIIGKQGPKGPQQPKIHKMKISDLGSGYKGNEKSDPMLTTTTVVRGAFSYGY